MSPPAKAPLDLLQRLEQLVADMRLVYAAPPLADPAPPDPPPAAPAADAPLRLAIDGTRSGPRTAVRANGSPVLLQDSVFALLLRFALAARRRPGSWSTKPELSIGKRAWMTSRLRQAFRGLLPAGLELIETDGRGSFRLNPAVVVEADLAALAEHPDGVVRDLAAKWSAAAGSAPPPRVASGP